MRDDFTRATRNAIAHRAGYRCSQPDCRAPTAGPGSDGPFSKTDIGVAAHITAASPNGPRYDKTITPADRRSAENGIWLCQNHAKHVDDDSARHTTEVLQAWKRQAERDASEALGKPRRESPFLVQFDLSLHRNGSNAILATGTTSLPDGTEFLASIHLPGDQHSSGQCRVRVHDGMILTEAFSGDAVVSRHGFFRVRLYARFQYFWGHAPEVFELVGERGLRLVGEHVHVEDSDIIQDARYVEVVVEQVPPPPMGTALVSRLADSIELVRTKKMRIENRQSRLAVSDIVEWFMGSDGLKPGEGWQAAEAPNASAYVTYHYLDGGSSAVATWRVVPASGDVRCVDLNAKLMSLRRNHSDAVTV